MRVHDIWRRRWELNDEGYITPGAVHVFLNGQCHAFAIAIRKLTGWEMVADDDLLGRGRGHIMSRVPGFGVMDILELQPDSPDYQVVTEKDLMNLNKRGVRSWLKPNIKAAMPFARRRLEETKQFQKGLYGCGESEVPPKVLIHEMKANSHVIAASQFPINLAGVYEMIFGLKEPTRTQD